MFFIFLIKKESLGNKLININMTNARSVFVITIIIIMNTGTAVYPRHSTVMPLMLHTCAHISSLYVGFS